MGKEDDQDLKINNTEKLEDYAIMCIKVAKSTKRIAKDAIK